jgi:hypothetical protein
MKAYVLAKIRTGEVGAALEQFRAVPGVRQADMTFGPFDLIATIEAGSLDALGRMVAWQLQPIVGVTETLTCLAVEPNPN